MMRQHPFLQVDNPASTAKALPEREDIDNKFKWRLEDLFENDGAWEAAFQEVEELIPDMAKCAGRLSESAENLIDSLLLRSRIEKQLSLVFLYAGLKNDQDTRESQYQAFRDRATALMVKANQATAFMEPEILAVSDDILESFLKESEELADYRHLLDNLLRTRAHVLPPEQEMLLAMTGEMAQTPYNIFSMFNNADIKFPTIRDEDGNEVEVTKGRYQRLIESSDRRVRKDAFDALYNTYGQWTNTLAAMLSSSVKRDIFNARARKFESSLESALSHDNIPVAVYDNVIESINQNLKPLQRYMKLRKKMLAVDDLRPWDLMTPLLSEADFEIPFEKALSIIYDGLSPLGDDYRSALDASFNDGWIDVYENQGKRSGAYSWATFGGHPYILLNYNKTLNDMFTVAHELGHALHSYYTFKTQPYHYSDYTIFVAEVASTLNEALLIHYLLNNTDDREKKLYLLNKYVDQIRGTVYIQALFAEFEKTIHERAEAGEALTAEMLNGLNRELYLRYFGSEFEMDAEYDINWCRIPHFYYNFYVFKYATGFSAATALSRKILSGDTDARDAYLRFLTRGSSAYSIDLLKDAGVDMNSPEPVKETTKLMNTLLDEMESLISSS